MQPEAALAQPPLAPALETAADVPVQAVVQPEAALAQSPVAPALETAADEPVQAVAQTEAAFTQSQLPAADFQEPDSAYADSAADTQAAEQDNLSYKTIAHALDNLKQKIVTHKTENSAFSSELEQILKQGEPEARVQVSKPEFKKVPKPQTQNTQSPEIALKDYADEVLAYIFSLKQYIDKKKEAFRKSGRTQLKNVVSDTEALIDSMISGQEQGRSAPPRAAEPQPRDEFSLSTEVAPLSAEEKLAASQAAALEQESWFEDQQKQNAAQEQSKPQTEAELVNPFTSTEESAPETLEEGELEYFTDEEGEDGQYIPNPEENYALISQDEHVHVTEPVDLQESQPMDGNPDTVTEHKRQEIEAHSKVQFQFSLGQKLAPEDFFEEVLKSDPWYKDIVAAGYKDDTTHSALTYSVRKIDPQDPSHWIVTMSQDFALFIQDPSFLHNITTKFSFLQHHALNIELKAYKGEPGQASYPPDCPYALGLEALGAATHKAKEELFSTPELLDFFRSQGQSPDSLEVTLLKQAPGALLRPKSH